MLCRGLCSQVSGRAVNTMAAGAQVSRKTPINQAEKSALSPAGGAVVQNSDTLSFAIKASYFFPPKSKTDEVYFFCVEFCVHSV